VQDNKNAQAFIQSLKLPVCSALTTTSSPAGGAPDHPDQTNGSLVPSLETGKANLKSILEGGIDLRNRDENLQNVLNS
jgi:hypothetical protein